ncbi:MAG: biotin/lipoyl-binding protein, partial [Bacteroidaceae bacterium]|nr:biotin/lipoyl-binding protein [Bacteroidaceae bacterium]
MRTYSYNINGAQYDVTIESIRDQVAKMNVNGVLFDVEILGAPLTEGDLPEPTGAVAPAPKAEAAPAAATPAAPAAKGAAGDGTPIKAPLPGVVTQVLVSQGQAVKKGDTVVVLEAMKMENNITAEA